MSTTRKALGRGLDALLPAIPVIMPGSGTRKDFLVCPIEEIRPAPNQPRRRFAEAALAELAVTIHEHGIVQPLLVRREPGRDGFVLIAGERRWRAAQKAGLREVPVVVKDATPRESFEMALVENLQRQDLDAIEEADAYQRLAKDYALSHEAIATRVGKDRSTIANAMRLLTLPQRVRDWVAEGTLTAGHARALLGLEAHAAIERAARHVAARGLSVRQTEALVRRAGRRATSKVAATAATREVEARLRTRLGTKVRLVARPGGAGTIEIDYHSLDELDRLLGVILP